MNRVRITTTVDGENLRRARSLLGIPDSDLVDRALALLIERVETDREVQILMSMPYDEDPDLVWHAPFGSGLPYDGEIPEHFKSMSHHRAQ